MSWYLRDGGGSGGKGEIPDFCSFYPCLASRHSQSTPIDFVREGNVWYHLWRKWFAGVGVGWRSGADQRSEELMNFKAL